MASKDRRFHSIIIVGRIVNIKQPKQGITTVYIDEGLGEEAILPVTIYGVVYAEKLNLYKGLEVTAICDIKAKPYQDTEYITIVAEKIIPGATTEERRSDKSERIRRTKQKREYHSEEVDVNELPF